MLRRQIQIFIAVRTLQNTNNLLYAYSFVGLHAANDKCDLFKAIS
jgi:hypothetical protein